MFVWSEKGRACGGVSRERIFYIRSSAAIDSFDPRQRTLLDVVRRGVPAQAHHLEPVLSVLVLLAGARHDCWGWGTMGKGPLTTLVVGCRSVGRLARGVVVPVCASWLNRLDGRVVVILIDRRAG